MSSRAWSHQWKPLSLAVMFCVGLAASAHAVPIDVFIDTSPVLGMPGNLAFDLLDSDAASNTATITDFFTDGALGLASSVAGPVSGSLPGTVTIADGSFFNELLQEMTFGSTISFDVELTRNFTGGIPDEFSFSLLDAAASFPLFPTTDPTRADALFTIDVNGSPTGQVTTFLATAPAPGTLEPVTWLVRAVPEPSSLVLLGSGLLGLLGIGLRRQRPSSE